MSSRVTRFGRRKAPPPRKTAPASASRIAASITHAEKRFHAVRVCRSLKGSLIFTNWQDCQSFLKKEKDAEHASFYDLSEVNSYLERKQHAPSNRNRRAAVSSNRKRSIDQVSDAAAAASTTTSPGASMAAASTTASPAASMAVTSTAASPATSMAAASTTASPAASMAADTTTASPAASVTAASTTASPAASPSVVQQQAEGAASAKAHLPSDPDTTELPVVLEGTNKPKREMTAWHLGRRQWKVEKTFQEKTQLLESFYSRFGREQNVTKHREYGKFDFWIDFIRTQAKVYRALKETGNAHDILKGSYFILFLKKAHMERLDAIGFPFGPESEKVVRWQERYEEMKQFKEKWGHVVVRRREKQEKVGKLISWVDLQRREYKRFVNGETSTMTEKRVAKLSELGLELNLKPAPTHEERAKEWLVYRATHGGAEPTLSSNRDLTGWVSRTREKYERLQKGERTGLTQEQVDQLDSWGFQWVDPNKKEKAPKKAWDEWLQEYVDYKNKHGTAWIPRRLNSLGSWCQNQRRLYKQMKRNEKTYMTAERVAKLDAVGFPWEKPEGIPYKNSGEKRRGLTNNDSATDSSDEDPEESDDEEQNGRHYTGYRDVNYRTHQDSALPLGYRTQQHAQHQQHGVVQHSSSSAPWERYKTSSRFR